MLQNITVVNSFHFDNLKKDTSKVKKSILKM